jgi:hypothetical protein
MNFLVFFIIWIIIIILALFLSEKKLKFSFSDVITFYSYFSFKKLNGSSSTKNFIISPHYLLDVLDKWAEFSDNIINVLG